MDLFVHVWVAQLCVCGRVHGSTVCVFVCMCVHGAQEGEGIVSVLWHMMLASNSSSTVDCSSCDVEDLCCAANLPCATLRSPPSPYCPDPFTSAKTWLDNLAVTTCLSDDDGGATDYGPPTR